MATKYHVRSNSFPSESHPSSTRIEQELTKIKTWEATSTSVSITTGLSYLEDLYISLEDLLRIASTQKTISHHQGEKLVEELLDGSVKILDICVGSASKSKAAKWLKVAKMMHKKVVCEEKFENSNELQCVEASLSALLREGSNVSKMQDAHEKIEALENAIEMIENGLESVFRRLVKTRVSLLNIMTQS
ncbi:unnamed protein product [Trifolium pratense]|uniref:Uncharacterized protein n=1 Tax=Trifolium pratense TaxID=57577 RepID=A0ACB0JSY6_TRIPR|nr:unnamed protein product [Trifolium pratense]